MTSATKNLLQIQKRRGSLKKKEKNNKTHNKINQTGKPKERQTLTGALFQAVHKTFETQLTYCKKHSKGESISPSQAVQV